MKKTNQEETKNLTGKEEQTNWVFIPVKKTHILKRTDKYVLFDVDGVASGIINAVFLRKKETEDFVFFSVPADYEVNCRVREQINGRWQTTTEYHIKAVNLASIVREHNNLEVVR